MNGQRLNRLLTSVSLIANAILIITIFVWRINPPVTMLNTSKAIYEFIRYSRGTREDKYQWIEKMNRQIPTDPKRPEEVVELLGNPSVVQLEYYSPLDRPQVTYRFVFTGNHLLQSTKDYSEVIEGLPNNMKLVDVLAVLDTPKEFHQDSSTVTLEYVIPIPMPDHLNHYKLEFQNEALVKVFYQDDTGSWVILPSRT